jgi:hypothetical protein
MATNSQFTIYTSQDTYGPGPMNGTTGSLIRVLDSCLVTGYTGKPAAGWTKPLGNISASCVSAYQQPSGSQFTLFVNDNSVAVTRTAAVTGWTSLVSLAGAVNANNVGSGSGQFPLPAQANTYGRAYWYKSATADTVQRNWIIAADAYTMYIWFSDGQSVGYYYHGGFGDFYSLAGSSDTGRCLLFGKYADNTTSIAGYESTDCVAAGIWNNNSVSSTTYMTGHYLAKNVNGGSSIRYNKKGDNAVSINPIGANLENSYLVGTNGSMPCPNPYDNNFYIAPIYIFDPTGPQLRGRYRGIYQLCHPMANFTNFQTITGTGKYAGKTFTLIYFGYNGGGWLLETSPTVETN